MSQRLKIFNAKVHNLKGVDLDLPKHKLVVFTGLSGSGKSSLAFDTIYAEGQRRYVESLSAYARQFLERLEKPDVERIEGLSPAISIDQKSASHNPRSTVGTVTEIYDYLRLLFAHIGKAYCPNCDTPIQNQSVEEICDHILAWDLTEPLTLYSPQLKEKKGEHLDLIEQIQQAGFTRVRLNGKLHRVEEIPALDKQKKHNLEIVIDRISEAKNEKARVFESLELALKHGNGQVIAECAGKQQLFSENLACSGCGFSFTEISPRLFSFNSPLGACEECKGLGSIYDFDVDKIFSDTSLSLKYATEKSISLNNTLLGQDLEYYGKKLDIHLNIPIQDLSEEQLDFILFGETEIPKRSTDYWPGLINILRKRYKQTYSENMRFFYRRLMSSKACPSCQGQRLCTEALSIKIDQKNIEAVGNLSISDALHWFQNLSLSEKEQFISHQILKEIVGRLGFLNNVGLTYLSINRKANTLSGGEAQRIRLATQIGSGLTGVLYILDEPSIGLHQRDNDRLIDTLKHLRDLGNTLIVVEHDEDTIREADHIVDIGPEAGRLGGEIIASGTLAEVLKAPQSITAQYLTGKKKIEIPKKRRALNFKKCIELKGASGHNLKNVSAQFPLKSFIAVTGVSGSGKSTLINRTLHPALVKAIDRKSQPCSPYDTLLGAKQIESMVVIDQSPIGRTPRSNPATYIGAFTPIRELFAQTKDSKLKGYKPGHFSFNTKGGRCEACSGDGALKVEMHFLADVFVTCDVCKGKRFNSQTLNVKFKGMSIYDILDTTVNHATEIFQNVPTVYNKLKTLKEVGLGYIKCGQSATTLSGGEAQRVKLAKELSKRNTGNTLYLLDEPTTGLHFDDIHKLLGVLHTLVDQGNTVIVIEHNLDVIKTADYVIDLGPEGGDKGGQIIVSGSPEDIAACEASHTGKYLQRVLGLK